MTRSTAARWSLVVSLGLALAPFGAAQQVLPFLNQLDALPASRARTIACNADGTWYFIAEGGMMTFIETVDATGAFVDTNFKLADGSKKVRIGDFGILPCRMLLDPMAATVPSAGPNDYIYIAAGRDGLWMMEANVTSSTNQAWLVDDSGDLNPATQNSRRWCSDVDVMTVNNDRYLVATFGRKSQSRLRVYKLDTVQAIATTGGAPIAPLVQVKLKNHPDLVPHAFEAYEFGRSVAGALCIDQNQNALDPEGTPLDPEEADVYVAMGHHGMLRVHFTAPHLTVPPTATPSVEWGPIMGEDTYYETQYGNVYGHLLYRDSPNLHPYLGSAVLERAERPFFFDLLVDREIADRTHIYVTVDHLGWMRFDLLNDTWGSSMPINHHEGRIVVRDYVAGANPESIEMVSQFEESVEPVEMGYATGLDLVEHPDPDTGPILAVTYSNSPLIKNLLTSSNEGVTYGSTLEWGGTHGVDFLGTPRTLFYRMDSGVTEGGFNGGGGVNVLSASNPFFNHDNWIGSGGDRICFPETQPHPDKLNIFHFYDLPTSGARILGTCLSVVDPGVVQTQGTALFVYERPADAVLGTQSFGMIQSVVQPDTLIISLNDSKFPNLGFIATDGNNTWANMFYSLPTSATNYLPAGSHRLDKGSVWAAGPTSPNEEYLFTSGLVLDFLDKGDRWMLMKYVHNTSGNPELDPPEIEDKWTMQAFPDSYGNIPRAYYQMAGQFPEMNSFATSIGESPLAFGTRLATPEGVSVFDRDKLVLNVVLHGISQDDHTVLAEDLQLPEPRLLVTHPEFNNMPRDPQAQYYAEALQWWERAGGEPNANNSAQTDPIDPAGEIHTSAPRAIEVKGADETWGRYVIAVPCGKINADPEWRIFRPTTPGYQILIV